MWLSDDLCRGGDRVSAIATSEECQPQSLIALSRLRRDERNLKWGATADENGHYCSAVAL